MKDEQNGRYNDKKCNVRWLAICLDRSYQRAFSIIFASIPFHQSNWLHQRIRLLVDRRFNVSMFFLSNFLPRSLDDIHCSASKYTKKTNQLNGIFDIKRNGKQKWSIKRKFNATFCFWWHIKLMRDRKNDEIRFLLK